MFALPISKPRFKSIIFFIKIALKWSCFCKKMQNFLALGAPPSVPQHTAPHCEFLATRLGVVEDPTFEAKAKDSKKNWRPRTGMLEAKDQGQNFASGLQKKKRSSRKRRRFFCEILSDFKKKGHRAGKPKIRLSVLSLFSFFRNQKNSASSSRGQGIFEGWEASRPRT